MKGKLLGKHDGIINYTIGQRRGIKIASKEPFYVVKIDNNNNTVIVGPKDALKINKIILREINILGSPEDFKKEIQIKVRSTGKLLRAQVELNSDKAEVNILDGENGISPGQACVFYLNNFTGDKVLGGGWIDKTFNKNLST